MSSKLRSRQTFCENICCHCRGRAVDEFDKTPSNLITNDTMFNVKVFGFWPRHLTHSDTILIVLIDDNRIILGDTQFIYLEGILNVLLLILKSTIY